MKLIRTGLIAIFAFAVFAFGAVEVWATSIVEIGAAILLLLWALVFFKNPGCKIVWNPLNYPLFGLLTLGAGQLLFHGTEYPFLTTVALLQLSACFIVFFLCTQVFRERGDLIRLAWVLIALCFVISLFGIIQHFTFDGKIYWLRKLTAGGELFGPFINRNHFAGFVELTLPVGLCLIVFRGFRRDVVPLLTLTTVVPIGALILSGSRGGIVALGFQLAVLVVLVRSRRSTESQRVTIVGIAALIALALVTWLGAGKVVERFSNLRASEVTLSRRASMVRGATHMFAAYPIHGAGLGTLVSVYPKFETYYDGNVVDHVHNDYIEILAEMGILGGICGLTFLWILLRDAKTYFFAEQGHFSRALHAGAVVALAGILLHSFVDFNLHILSNLLLFLLMAHLATSKPLPSESALPRRQRIRASRHRTGDRQFDRMDA